jgi:hypothetical protein
MKWIHTKRQIVHDWVIEKGVIVNGEASMLPPPLLWEEKNFDLNCDRSPDRRFVRIRNLANLMYFLDASPWAD